MAFKHLLVPTDFSEPANRALRHAIEEAGLHHPKATLLHVLPGQRGRESGAPGAVPGPDGQAPGSAGLGNDLQAASSPLAIE